MEVLKEMFPMFPDILLEQALNDAGSVDDAVVALLDTPLPDPEFEGFPPESPPGGAPITYDELMEMEDGNGMELAEDGGFIPHEIRQFPGLDDSIAKVVAILPDVCTDHVKKVYHENIVVQENNIVDFILNSLFELGSSYPRTEASNPRKRKRNSGIAEGNELESNELESRERERPNGYIAIARKLLQQEYPSCPVTYIDKVLLQNKYLLHSYAVIGSVYVDVSPPFKRLVTARKMVYIDVERTTFPNVYDALIVELQYAKEKAKLQQKNDQLAMDAQLAATLDIEEHEENGMMMECQCCYGESPFSSMTQCNEGHLFCLDCARRNAENEVGRGRYQLLCMAGCKSEFPRREMLRFLDERLILALEKNEQEEVLRMADIKDLTKCPFCDYAAICAPIEEDKEFRCRNPDCMEVSCRHCQQKTHIPATCQEASKDGKLSVRHKLEEAMTDALVRTCKKCSNKFIKESGCNKMSCSRCHTLQCYVCSETINGYDHFNDTSRGGSKTNKCPLFDNTEDRHDEDVEKAAKLVMQRLKNENPHITDEDLEIKLSEAVKKKKVGGPARLPEALFVGFVGRAPRPNMPAAPPVIQPPAPPVIQPPAPPVIQPPAPPVIPPPPVVLPVRMEAAIRNHLVRVRHGRRAGRRPGEEQARPAAEVPAQAGQVAIEGMPLLNGLGAYIRDQMRHAAQMTQEAAQMAQQARQQADQIRQQATQQADQRRQQATQQADQRRQQALQQARQQADQRRQQATRQADQMRQLADQHAIQQADQRRQQAIQQAIQQADQRRQQVARQADQMRQQASQQAIQQADQRRQQAMRQADQMRQQATQQAAQMRQQATQQAAQMRQLAAQMRQQTVGFYTGQMVPPAMAQAAPALNQGPAPASNRAHAVPDVPIPVGQWLAEIHQPPPPPQMNMPMLRNRRVNQEQGWGVQFADVHIQFPFGNHPAGPAAALGNSQAPRQNPPANAPGGL